MDNYHIPYRDKISRAKPLEISQTDDNSQNYYSHKFGCGWRLIIKWYYASGSLSANRKTLINKK